jgi:flagellar motor switch protein FliM
MHEVPPTPVSEMRAPLHPRGANRGTAVPYDFRHPTKLSREHVRLLQMAYETFARRLTTVLTGGLRQVCVVSLAEISQLTYDDYISGLSTPTLMVPIDVPPLAGTGVLEFSLPVALATVDHLLGGPGGVQQTRGLTDIETTLVTGVVDQILGVLRYAMESIVVIEPVAGPIEYNPPFLQAASASDPVIVGQFDLAIGRESCRMTLCLPLPELLPLLIAHRPRDVAPLVDAGAPQAARRLRERIGDVDIEVSVRFKPAQLSPARILNLAVGDLIVLDHRVGAPLSIDVGGAVVAFGVAGKSGPHLAALVVDTPVPPLKELV